MSSISLMSPAELYDPEVPLLCDLFGEEMVFPAEVYRDKTLLASLRLVGLKTELTPPCVERCIRSLSSSSEGGLVADSIVSRARTLLSWLDDHVSSTSLDAKSIRVIQTCNWLPVERVNPHAPLSWKGSSAPALSRAEDTRKMEDGALVGSSMVVINVSVRSTELLSLFGWNKAIPVEAVISRLLDASKCWQDLMSVCYDQSSQQSSLQQIGKVVKQVYKYLSSVGSESEVAKVRESLVGCRWIWLQNRFVEVHEVAIKCDQNLSPYRHSLPQQYASYYEMFTRYGVEEMFSESSLVRLLNEVAEHAEGRALETPTLDMVVRVLELLTEHGQVGVGANTLMVPTSEGYLRPSRDVAFNDMTWLKGKVQWPVTHTKLSHFICRNLNMKTYREKILEESGDDSSMFEEDAVDEEEFGQHEPLTVRLHNLLSEYPEGTGVIKELLQNADDAKASDFKFLLDRRTHGKQSLICQEMEHWQGPALYAYNSAVFEPKDFQNICRLGGGGKMDSMDKIGKFGLGFIVDVSS